MTCCLVTGGLGFVGSHLLRRLLDRGDRVRILDVMTPEQQYRTCPLTRGRDFDFVQGDVRDPAAVTAALQGVDHIFHMASHVGLLHYFDDPVEVADVIYSGTRQVALAAIDRRLPLTFLSTSELYGRNPVTPWREDADRVMGNPSKSRWVYATAKGLCEHFLFGLAQHRGLRFSTVRFFNLYGPGQDSTFFITRTLWRLTQGLPPVVFDGGSQVRCFTYIDDAIDGLLLTATSPAAQGQAFNIGSDIPTTVMQAIQTLAAGLGLNPGDLVYEHQDSRDVYGADHEEPVARIPDIGKARTILGWSPHTSLFEGAQHMRRWIEQHGWWIADDAKLSASSLKSTTQQ